MLLMTMRAMIDRYPRCCSRSASALSCFPPPPHHSHHYHHHHLADAAVGACRPLCFWRVFLCASKADIRIVSSFSGTADTTADAYYTSYDPV